DSRRAAKLICTPVRGRVRWVADPPRWLCGFFGGILSNKLQRTIQCDLDLGIGGRPLARASPKMARRRQFTFRTRQTLLISPSLPAGGGVAVFRQSSAVQTEPPREQKSAGPICRNGAT